MLAKEVKEKLIKIVGLENVEDSPVERLVYSYDATPQFQALPDAVVSPRNTKEVAEIVKICNEYNIPIVPRGSGTNLCAGTCPTEGGIVLLFKHMNSILEIDEENLTVTVQPGVITLDMIRAVEEKGLFYPPDPSSLKISTMGGNINENSGGLRGLKYGVTGDYVLALEVVLANGEVIRTGGKLAKDVAGYDLTRLMVGSEGTLGIVTEATCKLIPKPESKQTMLALYQDIEAAAQTVSSIIANKVIPTTLEFLDQPTLKVVEAHAQIGLPTDVQAVLLIEQDGPSEVVKREMEKMHALCEQGQAISVQIAESEDEAEALRTARRSALSALARLKPTTILEDATVPRSEIANMVKVINEIAEKYELTICTFGHAGDGNLHPTCLTDIRNHEEIERVEKAFAEIFEKAIALGGTITGEHGVGVMKAPYLERKLGEAGMAAMKAIKEALDPNHIMNPGKVFAKDCRKRVVVSR
ncbi:glycolate oxidase subunit GlcD [Halalkalibacterium halodurans]|uniref:Glycolate oxidase subunit n=1 Tax=Halalkalibacterium halodurans (strain ATCC BAA-125 / DSM 18197 / FERM 7344 / JCM 9153 / C-125) TaxID=272558 RepID=Q9K9B9_HALH5|nr:glycolate oxidase subunit GlcD [Halalkalibacterium halodurans]MED4080283.1 glycolate oxidase subunit GlcD [Halalkalibacterium halodurans]MED4084649.1 glycolate oxidase subunit GlcD [Halalkalibacterium halodurans]MED4103971.1 glycolate oxidase subunit GlcD [Halalkalibacterium halodurans]MED4108957.1 glycolate oxidase subunit GlcD [Halalkalibacterium halodurans]MED4125277.1 glycolate oxidase subunit GlcD [Halalkalibacterium halodurans]